MDITAMPPFARVACPSCSEKSRVKLEFGPYHLDRRLSTGGMSVLFVARDTLLNREVAVKILNEEYSADEKRITAFEEEARVTASLSHPNIVRVLTTGRAFGRFFIAMELVPGGHFEHHIRTEGKILEPRMLKLAIQIASGLKAAHEAKLIHRDIKPGNILLDADGNAKIVDFGLALVTQGGTAKAKEFWATPYYVPPETIEGAAEDFRTDIYAFGATLYHALAGKPPCNEESISVDLLRAAKKNIVPLHLARPELSMAVCEIVDKAMAYHPYERYASYDELINDLQDAANRTKHGLNRESAGQVANRRSRARRSRRIAAASAGLLGGIALISALAWITNRREDPPPLAPIGRIENPNSNSSPGAITVDLGKNYQEARESYTRRSYGAAVDRFARLYHNPQVLEPTRTWAGIQAVVAALLDEDGSRARTLSTELVSHLSKVDAGDPEISAILAPLLNQIIAEEPLSFHNAKPPRSGAPALIACLLVGIHEWQFGDYKKAVPHFKTVLGISLDDGAQWFAIHQGAARDHLNDLEMLDNPAYHRVPQNLESAEEAYEELESLRSQVRTRGPISEILRTKRNEIRTIIRRFEAQAEREAEEAERETGLTNPFDPPEDPPAEHPATRDRVLELLANYDFKNARETMLELDETQIEVRQRTAWMTVARGAENFMVALAQDIADNAIPIDQLKLKSGETATNIQPHPQRTPADSIGIPIPWANIHVDSYIDWHRARIQLMNEPDRIHAHEAAIAFDLLAGDPARAITAIQRLSETNANFESYWRLILDNYPK